MKNLLARLLCALALLTTGACAVAQVYPDRPVTIIVPFAAGSAADVIGRIVALKLAERLKQPVVVDNKPGATGQIGVEMAAKAKPDGYTLVLGSSTTHSANPSLYKTLRYDPVRDFTPIGRAGVLPYVLVVSPALPVRTTKELIDHAKASRSKLSFAYSNSTALLAAEMLGAMAGVELIKVAYKSGPQALTDMLAGHIDLYVVDFASGLPSIRGGKLRPLGLTTGQSSRQLPDVAPLSDTIPGFELSSWAGFFGPANLPKSISDRLAAELQTVLEDKEVQEKFAVVGFDVVPSKSREEFAKYVSDQTVHWARLIKQARIQPE